MSSSPQARHKTCTKPLDSANKFLSPKIRSVSTTEDMVAPIRRISASLETSVTDMKTEVVDKIDKELINSHNTREYITQRYDELCGKIQSLAEVSCTVSTFKSELKNFERTVDELQHRVDQLEKKFRPNSPLPQPGLRPVPIIKI